MATHTITVNSIMTTQAMGGDLQLWGTMEWGTDPWGISDEEYASAHKVLIPTLTATSDFTELSVDKVISNTQASTSDFTYLEVTKLITNTITLSCIEAKTFVHDPIDFGSIGMDFDAENQSVIDGEGFNYIWADRTNNANTQTVMDWAAPASITTAYSQSSGATPSVEWTNQSDPTV